MKQYSKLPRRASNYPSPSEERVLLQSQLAHLATADAEGQPYLVPCCFVFTKNCLYTAVDKKPKTVEPNELKRIRNIRENPRVALIVDHYEEDWNNLYYVLVLGRASTVTDEAERIRAINLLERKYPQYIEMAIGLATVIRIRADRIQSWGRLLTK